MALSLLMMLASPPCWARTAATPWTHNQEENFSNLIYGSSSPRDVELTLGKPPDEVVKNETVFPVVWNYLYYDERGSGSATVFVFENGMLVGMFYKSPGDQLIDLTYFLTNRGDRRLFAPMNNGYLGYYFYPQYYAPFGY